MEILCTSGLESKMRKSLLGNFGEEQEIFSSAPQFEGLHKLLLAVGESLDSDGCTDRILESWAAKIVNFILKSGLDFSEEDERGFESKAEGIPLPTVLNLFQVSTGFLFKKRQQATVETDLSRMKLIGFLGGLLSQACDEYKNEED